jgi:uncharacterized protein
MYDEDGELPLNHERCLELYQFLASKGCLHAMICLGHFYANGWGTPKDDRMAAEYNNRAYLHGDGEGGMSLAYMYKEGEGVPQDLAKSQQYILLPSPASN